MNDKSEIEKKIDIANAINSLREDGISVALCDEESEEEILKKINLRIKSKRKRERLHLKAVKKIKKFIKTTEDGVNHFSVSLTNKYQAYSCFTLPSDPMVPYIAGLVVKVRNKKDNSENFLFTLFTFDRKNLGKDLILKDKFYLDLFNKLLEENLIYLTSEKFTNKRIELGIQKFINNELNVYFS